MIQSKIIIDGILAGKDKWARHIDSLRAEGKASKEELKNAIIDAVKKRIPKERFGIFFSGGVDSSLIALICRQANADFACYSVGIEGSPDINAAKKAAKAIGAELKHKIISLKEAERLIRETTKTIGPDVMKVGVGAVIYAAAELGIKDGIKTFFSGLGAEEIFAGYERHIKAKDANEECWLGLKEMYERDFLRDYSIAKKLGISVLTPFLDQGLIKSAMQVPGSRKISSEHKKIILREIAEDLGLPREFAWRKKSAAQYGSGIQKAMSRLARDSGFRMIPRYLFSFYSPTNMRLGALISSGKDSMYAMYKMMKMNYRIGCMITMKSENPDSYMFHSAAVEMAELQAKSAGIPFFGAKTRGIKEEELVELKKAVEAAKKKYKIKGIVTGALYSNYQRERIEKIAAELGIEIFSPLWHMDQEKYMKELISSGFEFIITKVAADGLDKSWLNRAITNKDVDKLAELNKKIGLNIAFEGGEAESLVIDCPIFRKRIKITDYEIEEESGIVAELRIKKAELEDKP